MKNSAIFLFYEISDGYHDIDTNVYKSWQVGVDEEATK